MADYKKYAENLIGNWEKDIYEPQKQVTKDIYQTNWNKLTNDYNTVRDKLNRNFQLAREQYANTLNDVQNSSFNRMNNANIDLANRGLSSSGMLDLVSQADTQSKGEDVDKALASLLDTNNATLTGLTEGVIDLGSKQSGLAGDLGTDIGKLTDADAANMQQYGGLLGSIGESAAGRASSRSGGGSSRLKKAEEEQNELYRRMGIVDTLNDDTLSEQEKRIILTSNYDMPIQDANDAISAQNYTNTKTKLDEANRNLNRLNSNALEYANPNNPLNNIGVVRTIRKGASGINDLLRKNAQNKIDKLNDELSNYTYEDLWNILNR